MSRIGRTLAMAFGVLVAGQPAQAADELGVAVGAIPAAVSNVQLLGAWEEGERRGIYRIVVARDGPDLLRGRLFVQWLSESFDPPALAVTASVEVDELSALDMRLVEYRSETDKPNELVLHVDAVDPATGAEQNFFLQAHGPGAYVVKPADH